MTTFAYIDPHGTRKILLGDIVRHRGTKRWASVREIILYRDGSAELILVNEEGKLCYWATYHIDYIQEFIGPRHHARLKFAVGQAIKLTDQGFRYLEQPFSRKAGEKTLILDKTTVATVDSFIEGYDDVINVLLPLRKAAIEYHIDFWQVVI